MLDCENNNNNYLLTKIEVFKEKVIDRDLAVFTKLYQACLYSKVKVIGLQVLQENNALHLANQSACYIGYENKWYNSN